MHCEKFLSFPSRYSGSFIAEGVQSPALNYFQLWLSVVQGWGNLCSAAVFVSPVLPFLCTTSKHPKNRTIKQKEHWIQYLPTPFIYLGLQQPTLLITQPQSPRPHCPVDWPGLAYSIADNVRTLSWEAETPRKLVISGCIWDCHLGIQTHPLVTDK